jgi:hypothetical protein
MGMGMGMGMEEAVKQRACMRELVRTAVILEHHSSVSDPMSVLMREKEKRKKDHSR